MEEEEFDNLLSVIDKASVQPCPQCGHRLSHGSFEFKGRTVVTPGIETFHQSEKGGAATCHICELDFMWEWEE